MREFIKKCLSDLESLTGLRQLFFLEQREDGKKQIQTVITGILNACARYSYIPEEAQKRIITQMMMEDQDYESLNGRTVGKWLEANKGHYYFKTEKEEKHHEPAPPEVADKYLKQLLANLEQIGKPAYMNGLKELREEAGFIKQPKENQPTISKEELAMRALKWEWISTCFHPVTREKNANWMEFEEWIEKKAEEHDKMVERAAGAISESGVTTEKQ